LPRFGCWTCSANKNPALILTILQLLLRRLARILSRFAKLTGIQKEK
jgi:hypothetical protein